MNMIMNKISPSATEMIRMDHTHVIAMFHQYKFDDDPETKQANVSKNCLAIEIHAQLEEEYFYPALRRIQGDNAVLRKSVPEHDELRHLIATLRATDPSDSSYDDTYMQLLRNVLHHVADEEAVLLPSAERLLSDQLHEIGAQMTRRRIQLMARHAGQYVSERVRQQPAKSLLIAAGAVVAGTVLARRSFGGSRSRASEGHQSDSRASNSHSSDNRSFTSELRDMAEVGMKSGHAGFKLGHLFGKGEGMSRGLLWRKRAEAARV